MTEQPIYIASMAGCLYYHAPPSDKLFTAYRFPNSGPLMGLERKNNFFYVGGRIKIFKLKMASDKLELNKTFITKKEFQKKRPQFHRMMIIDQYLYITATNLNQIWKFDLELNFLKRIKINPPDKSRLPSLKRNYNHLNSIFRYKSKFYVDLNWLTQTQYASSGVAVLDKDFNELDRFEYGWQSHNFTILNNSKYVLCGSSNRIKKIYHPHRAGLMVDGELVFEWDPDRYFCKDYSIDDNCIYIVGGDLARRKDRDFSDGVIFILDRKFELIKKYEFKQSGEFMGCMLKGKDLVRETNFTNRRNEIYPRSRGNW